MAEVKFKDGTLDRSLFLADVNRLDLMNASEIPQDVHEGFIKRRRKLMTHFKDFRKAQRAKSAWRRHRFNMLKGVKIWNNSLKSKKFHRQLGRFLATRITENYDLVQDEVFSNLKSLSSLRTHIYIEGEYYRPLEEDVDHYELVDYVIPLLNSIEMKLLTERSQDITYDELEVVLRLVDHSEVQSALTEFMDDQSHSVEDLYKSIELSEDLTYGITAKYCKLLSKQSTFDMLMSEMDFQND